MALTSSRVYVGSLNVATLNGVLFVDTSRFSVASVQYVPRYGATIGAWVGKVQRAMVGAPIDFTTPVSFTSSVLDVVDLDLNGVDRLAVVTTTVGTSGYVDVYIVGKAD